MCSVYPSQLFSLPSFEQRSGAAIKYAKAEKLVAADNLFPIINKPIFKPSLQTTFHPITTQGNESSRFLTRPQKINLYSLAECLT